MSRERGNYRDLNTLSAYLDGTLKENQRERLISRLEREPELRQWLDNLRQTKTILGQLPRLRAPHNFTLTPDMVTVRRQKKQPMTNALRLASSLAAVLLVVLLGVDYLFIGGRLQTRNILEAPMMESASEISEANPEPLIQWGEPGAEGGGAEMSIEGKGGGATGIEEPMEERTEPEVPIELEEAPPVEKQLQQGDADAQDEMILGINPDQAGEVIDRSESTQSAEKSPFNWQKLIRLAQVTIAVLALGGGLVLLILRHRRIS